MTSQICIIIAIVIYLCGMIYIGISFSKKNTRTDEFYLGGRKLGPLVIVIFFVPYTASGFAACGKLFSTLFGMHYMVAMLLSAAVIVLYCTLGGFLAVSTTDLIQGITMTIALVIVVIFSAIATGGLGTIAANAQELPAFIIALIVNVIVSLVTAAPGGEIVRTFEEVN